MVILERNPYQDSAERHAFKALEALEKGKTKKAFKHFDSMEKDLQKAFAWASESRAGAASYSRPGPLDREFRTGGTSRAYPRKDPYPIRRAYYEIGLRIEPENAAKALAYFEIAGVLPWDYGFPETGTVVAAALGRLAHHAMLAGNLDRAQKLIEDGMKSLEAAHARSTPHGLHGLSVLMAHRGDLHQRRGENEQAVAVITKAIELGHQSGLPEGVAFAKSLEALFVQPGAN